MMGSEVWAGQGMLDHTMEKIETRHQRGPCVLDLKEWLGKVTLELEV